MDLTRQVALISNFHYLIPIVWKDTYNLRYTKLDSGTVKEIKKKKEEEGR